MLVNLTYSNIDSGCLIGIRFLFIRIQGGSRARMAAIKRVCGLFERGSMLEQDKDSLIVKSGKNGTGRGLWQSRRVAMLGVIDPSPADRTICKYGTSVTWAGKTVKYNTIANVIYVTYCVSSSTRVITFVMILFTLINEILYCYSNNTTYICIVRNDKRFFEVMKGAKTLAFFCGRNHTRRVLCTILQRISIKREQ